MKSLLIASCVALLAPYQCASGETAERPVEDSAPKALWSLARRFEKQGDSSACSTVQEQLIEQYPSSRYAKQARETSCQGGGARSSGSAGETASSDDSTSGDDSTTADE